MAIMRAKDLHEAVESRLNAGDVDGLVELYEDGATMIQEDGALLQDPASIRGLWALMAGLDGTMTLSTRYAYEVGDLALLRNGWTFESADYSAGGETAEVARRQPDGTWKYVIDSPFGADPVDA